MPSFHDILDTIFYQRHSLIREGVQPNKVLIGPAEWKILDDFIRNNPLSTPAFVSSIAVIGSMEVVKTIQDGVEVVRSAVKSH